MSKRDAARDREEPWRRATIEFRGTDYAGIICALNAHDDLVAALKAAMDYIGNGFQPPELIAQANAALEKAGEL